MNIYDISEKAGVSIATVSRVINKNNNVSEKTKEKVLSIIEEYGYTPNAFARGLGLDSMNTVGILCANASDPYLASAVYFLEQELRKHNYDALLCCTGYDVNMKRKYLNLLLSKRVDGIILIGSNFVESKDKENEYIRKAAHKVPIMLLNGILDGANIYSIYCDDFHATHHATTALIQSGTEHILYLYNSHSFSGIKKMAGYKSAMNIEHAVEKEKYIQYFEGTIQETKNFLLSLKQKGLFFNGIITSDDNLGVGAIKYAKAANLSIPTQLSIIGYNNSIIAQCCEPELTSIDNKLNTICNTCVKTLIGIFSGEQVPYKTVFSAEIIKRNTTKF